MENQIEIFRSEKFGEIRTVEISDEPWFVGKDVAKALGYSNPQKAIRDHVDEEDKTVNESFTVNGTSIVLINESGLYSLIFSSKLESAKEFKHWVTSEVLPSIRKTGSYNAPRISDKEIEVKEKEIGLARFNALHALANEYADNKTYKQILDAHATKELSGEYLLPLPKLEEKNYSATEVGEMLGISKNAVGKIAKRLGIKTDGEFGKWYVDKSPFSNKEVNTFRYSGKAVDLIRKEV